MTILSSMVMCDCLPQIFKTQYQLLNISETLKSMANPYSDTINFTDIMTLHCSERKSRNPSPSGLTHTNQRWTYISSCLSYHWTREGAFQSTQPPKWALKNEGNTKIINCIVCLHCRVLCVSSMDMLRSHGSEFVDFCVMGHSIVLHLVLIYNTRQTLEWVPYKTVYKSNRCNANFHYEAYR